MTPTEKGSSLAVSATTETAQDPPGSGQGSAGPDASPQVSPSRPAHGKDGERGASDAPAAPPVTALPFELAARIDVSPSGCWIWTGARTANGYGHLRSGDGYEYVHRLVYTLLVGPIADGMQIDHLCRVKACCNPAHLEPVTPAENVRRGKPGVCPAEHPYDEENTYLTPGGARRCRTCARELQRRRRALGCAA